MYFKTNIIICFSMSGEQRKAHPCVVPWKHFLCDRRYIIQKELLPFFIEAHLIHVDINSGDIFISTLDSSVLKEQKKSFFQLNTMVRQNSMGMKLRKTTTYHISTSWPLAKMFHLFNKIIAGHVGENREPEHIRARLHREFQTSKV